MVLWWLLACGAMVPAPELGAGPATPPSPADEPPEAQPRAVSDDRGPVPQPPAPLPPSWSCAASPSRIGCYVMLPRRDALLGAQATSPHEAGFDPLTQPGEAPVRRVTLPAVTIMRHEATESMWVACREAGACTATAAPNTLPQELASVTPATGLSFDAATELCAWMGGRLPSEDEWESAARGVHGWRWPWGDVPSCGVSSAAELDGLRAWASEVHAACEPLLPALAEAFDEVDALANTLRARLGAAGTSQLCAEVAALRGEALRGAVLGRIGSAPEVEVEACALPELPRKATLHHQTVAGLIGMGGSVWEWVADDGPDGRRWVKGGSWRSTDPAELRGAHRQVADPSRPGPDVGVRCVR